MSIRIGSAEGAAHPSLGRSPRTPPLPKTPKG